VSLLAWKLPGGQRWSVVLLAGGLGGALVLAATQASLAWTAVAASFAVGLACLAIIGQVRRPLLAVLVFTVPLHLEKVFLRYPGHLGGPSGAVIHATDVVLLVLVCLWFCQIVLGHRRLHFFPGVSLPALLLILISLVSALNAPDPLLSSFQLFEYAKNFVLYLYVANCVLDESDARWVLAGLICAVAFQSSLGMYQALMQHPLGLQFLGEPSTSAALGVDGYNGVRPRGTLAHANSLAMYLGMTLPVIMAVFLASGHGKLKALAGGVVGPGLIALVYTLSRGGWMGIMLSLLTLLALYPKGHASARFLRLLGGVLVLLIGVVTLNQITGGDINQRLTRDDRGAAEARVPLMRGAFAIIADHPLLGTGTNNYAVAIQQYDPAGGLGTLAGGGNPVGIVHNSFLLVAAETGLFGLAAFVWLLMALGWRGVGFLRGRQLSLASALTIGLLASGLHMVTHSMIDFILFGDPQLTVWFWCLAGLTVAMTAQHGSFAQIGINRRENGRRDLGRSGHL
jgi:putative inorganic carbon (hco3(-)) transporter